MKWFITGGAGFIGINSALDLIKNGSDQVLVYDNFERVGTHENINAVSGSSQCTVVEGDIRNKDKLNDKIKMFSPDVVLHLAGQVAVTKSVEDPRHDMMTNIVGTFNVLEAVREHAQEAVLINASTNKVFGDLSSISLVENESSYDFENIDGVSEDFPIEFHSPYGCSKGSAEQYVLDYSRIYDMNTVSFRQSCVYGRHQFGVEDQGWVAWFIIAHILDEDITIYGDGKQVRDVLFVEDLIDAYKLAVRNIDDVSGHVFNIGGGRPNSISLRDSLELLSQIHDTTPSITYSDWRPGDQKVYISDIQKAQKLLGWVPEVSVEEGLQESYDWMKSNIGVVKELY
jgi:CDP-paratose 2-epimerase